ncbi:MAG: UDP-N-acetylglucosamine 2-epimerase (hydrolyzing) [Alphaproteobacteria bacterium]|nr:UDP-N-acetylglucosamine 2-epimerase (hydrolyzing) [Alphaproteobacteria bacterium]
MTRRRIAIALTTRGNYAKMKSTMRAIAADPALELATLVGGGIVQSRFGDYRPIIERDGFRIDAVIDFLVEDGATLAAQTESAGRAVTTTGAAFGRLAPDIALVIADRYEAVSIALAAACMNVPIAHLEGGEVSGSIDERFRHAITKLAHLHLPANDEAAERIERMGETRERIVVVGTPSLDLLAAVDLRDAGLVARAPGGSGDAIDWTGGYLVVSQHPVPTESESAASQIDETAAAVARIGLPTAWMLPNMDAGGDGVARVLDALRARGIGAPLRFYPSLPLEPYAVLLHGARCLVGNSSSGIREGAFLGVPVVNVGSRQHGRRRGRNVIDVANARDAIEAAIRQQLAHGRYASDPLYGDGHAGTKIAAALKAMPLGLEKTIAY